MLHPKQLHPYQREAIWHLGTHDQAMLHLDMGLGKTIICLTDIQTRKDMGVHGGTLVVAPLRPARTVWEKEASRWSHTGKLTFSYILGAADERLRALFRPADIYVINYENLAWLATHLTHYFLQQGKYPPFGSVIFDEISKMKNTSSKRVEGFLPMMPYIKRRIGLTGTPASNGLMDLHGQYLMVDDGLRLGVDRDVYRDRFFHQIDAYNYSPDEGALDHVARVVADITLEMREEDYLDLPDTIFNDVMVPLSAELMQKYERLEMEFFMELDNGAEVEVFNKASLSNKLLQFSNGAVYLEPGQPEFEIVHDAKLDALDEIYRETGNEPVLLAYAYKSDAARIMAKYPDAINLSGTTADQSSQIIDDWVAGKIKLLIGHPASMGHGTDRLQYRGRHMVWFGLNWSLELYLQFLKRLDRQGQVNQVIVHRILGLNTLDEAQALRLEMKDDEQKDIRKAIDL
ncbi:MAG: ATP-dependent helicase, partial [Gammaproteobacteria bacterium]|nr:ATP-dependent helicase [Gammaproteobacteria bacterium]